MSRTMLLSHHACAGSCTRLSYCSGISPRGMRARTRLSPNFLTAFSCMIWACGVEEYRDIYVVHTEAGRIRMSPCRTVPCMLPGGF